ncbi:MAG: hypothetical protein GPW19_01875 [Euryarchaeota archaeon]|nr:hypothetical protein [Euryarchaeota archaeon]
MIEKVKILLIIPIQFDINIENDIKNYIVNYSNELFEIDYIFTENGPRSIETSYDEEIASYEVLKIIKNNLKKGYDSFIIDCFLGPGVEGARELTKIPVIHPGEVALYTAITLGNTFAFVDILPESIPISLRMLRKLGVLEHLSAIININTPVLDLYNNKDKIISLILEDIKKKISEKPFGSVVLGCTGLSSISNYLQNLLESQGYYLPVIDPILVSINYALFLKRTKLKYSGIEYPFVKKER